MTDLPVTAREPGGSSDIKGSSLIWQLLSVTALILWLATLGLWWLTRHRSKNTKPIPQPKPAQAGLHPFHTALLEAFGSRTLEEGLNKWEQLHGQDPEVHNTVRAVQKLCYSEDKSIPDNEIRDAVKKTVIKIKETSITTKHDPWSPRSFTPGMAIIEGKQ